MLRSLLTTRSFIQRGLYSLVAATALLVIAGLALAGTTYANHGQHGAGSAHGRIPGAPDFMRIGKETRRYDPSTRSYVVSRPGQRPANAYSDVTSANSIGGTIPLPEEEDSPVCAMSGHRIVVVRTYSALDPQTSGADVLIRSLVRRMNWKFMQESQISSDGARTLQMKVDCSASGMIRVKNVEIPTNYLGNGIDTTDGHVDHFDAGNAAILQYGRPENLGVGNLDGRRAVKYLVFHDDGGALGGGVAQINGPRIYKSTSDDSYDPGANQVRVNSNWAVVGISNALNGQSIALHEILHAMGAAYYNAPGSTPDHPDWVSAPFASSSSHCIDGIDILCTGSSPGYDETSCPASAGYDTPDGVPIDCNYDTYFDAQAEPGEWLDQWWNLGGVENPYLIDHETRFDPDVDGYLQADLVTLKTDGTAYTYPAFGWINPFKTSFAGALNSALYDGTGYDVVDVADVDGDGKADMVALRDNGTIHVYPGQYTGTFGSGAVSFGTTMNSGLHDGVGFEPIAVADVDGDGTGDLVTHRSTDGKIYTYSGDSYRTFGGGGSALTSGVVSDIGADSALFGGDDYFLDVADVDGDGHADLVSASDSPGSETVSVYTGDGNGEFSPASEDDMSWVMDGGTGNEPVGLGDVNGDGRADLVTVRNSTLYTYAGRSDASFDTQTPSSVSFVGTMNSNLLDQTGDEIVGVFDESGDGFADLVVAQANGSVKRYEGKQDFTFITPPRTTSPSTFTPNRFNPTSGHEIVIEKPFWRRKGCTPSGCAL